MVTFTQTNQTINRIKAQQIHINQMVNWMVETNSMVEVNSIMEINLITEIPITIEVNWIITEINSFTVVINTQTNKISAILVKAIVRHQTLIPLWRIKIAKIKHHNRRPIKNQIMIQMVSHWHLSQTLVHFRWVIITISCSLPETYKIDNHPFRYNQM